MAIINREFKNFEHILRHKIDKNGITFITITNKMPYISVRIKLDYLLPLILEDSATICTTTRKADLNIIRYCFEKNISVETVNLYSSSVGSNVYARLPKKVEKAIILNSRKNRVVDSISKYYKNFTEVHRVRI